MSKKEYLNELEDMALTLGAVYINTIGAPLQTSHTIFIAFFDNQHGVSSWLNLPIAPVPSAVEVHETMLKPPSS